jgi:hypothetical protein
MKIYRYMSFAEFNAMMSGITLEHKGFAKRKLRYSIMKSNHTGFSFFPESVEFSMLDEKMVDEELIVKEYNFKFTPEGCYSFLRGHVSSDVLVEFEVLDESKLNLDSDIYNIFFVREWVEDFVYIHEYHLKQYDWTILRPLKAKIIKGYNMTKNGWFDLHVNMEDVDMIRKLQVMDQLEELFE